MAVADLLVDHGSVDPRQARILGMDRDGGSLERRLDLAADADQLGKGAGRQR
jgi:hypothetical protein